MITTPLIPLPLVVATIQENRPDSILDVGCGFGRYGFLFRETLDVSFRNEHSFSNKAWTTKIDAVEVFPERITELQKYIYNKIFVGDIIKIIDEDIVGSYDVIFMGDLIEHLTKDEGWKLLHWAYAKANKMVIITTPGSFYSGPQDQEYDKHKSLWQPRDFRNFLNRKIVMLENRVLCAFLIKPNVDFVLPMFYRSALMHHLGRAGRAFIKKFPLTTKLYSLARRVKERLFYREY